MKNARWFISTIAVIFLTSCAAGSGEGNAAATTNQTGNSAATAAADTSKSVWKDVNSSNEQTSPAAAQPATQTTNVALNPEHGQPNHRCDIEVGAPLNSPVQQGQQMPASAKPLPATPAQGSVKLNPAHGLPGHDCAVAVGAPLKGS